MTLVEWCGVRRSARDGRSSTRPATTPRRTARICGRGTERARSLRLVRLYDPDGGVQLVDFAAEVRDQSRALHDLERATAAKERALREATKRWGGNTRGAAGLGSGADEVAEAAGLSHRE